MDNGKLKRVDHNRCAVPGFWSAELEAQNLLLKRSEAGLKEENESMRLHVEELEAQNLMLSNRLAEAATVEGGGASSEETGGCAPSIDSGELASARAQISRLEAALQEAQRIQSAPSDPAVTSLSAPSDLTVPSPRVREELERSTQELSRASSR